MDDDGVRNGAPRNGAGPTLAVVGAGAAGAMTAIHVCDAAVRRRSPMELVLVDPAPEAGRGAAYATRDPAHRLNVPVGGMSCRPDDPDHFRRWLCRHGDETVTSGDFVSRHRFGSYLADTLGRAIIAAHGVVRVRRLRTTAVGYAPRPAGRARLTLADGTSLDADAVVLATGPAPGRGPLPEELRGAPGVVAEPWMPHVLDPVAPSPQDVLLLGAGLTAVDVALTLARPGRTVHAVSRSGRLPRRHALAPLPPLAPPPALTEDLTRGRGLPPDRLRTTVLRHLAAAQRAHGDWRPAMDGLRPVTAGMWQALTEDGKAEALRRDATGWNIHRHRMPPATAETLQRALAARRLRVHAGGVASVRPALTEGEFDVVLADGQRLHVGWVIDCTGPGLRDTAAADPLWRGLLEHGHAVPGPLGMGVATDRGRLLDAHGRTDRALLTLGAPRRGELWETTAVPEIRVQAAQLADVLVPDRRPPRGRRPVDALGLPLTASAEAADAYRRGLLDVMAVGGGADAAFREAAALDPGFALAHAALALLAHEGGTGTAPGTATVTDADTIDAPGALARAQRAVRERGDERERSFVDVVTRRLTGDPGAAGATGALVAHLERYPGDALPLSVAVPTIASSGSAGLDDALALRLVERAAQAQGGHWFPVSLLAFLRQEQGRHAHAAELAGKALADEPAAGHAAHAVAHVHYETGDHAPGRDWLEGWLTGDGRGAAQRAHFAWHVALHDLALEDTAALRRRWFTDLAPGRVRGVRALVDSGSLLWRARLAGTPLAPEGAAARLLEAAAPHAVERPATAFAALHSAVTLTAAGDAAGLRRLAAHAEGIRAGGTRAGGAGAAQRAVIAPLCAALEAVVEERWDTAVTRLTALRPRLGEVGGSAAQREVVEETLLYALASAGRCAEASALLRARLDRRPSPLDTRRLAELRAR